MSSFKPCIRFIVDVPRSAAKFLEAQLVIESTEVSNLILDYSTRNRNRIPISSTRPDSLFSLPTLPSLEVEVETLFWKRQIADRDLIALLLYRHYVEILQQSGYC